MARKLSFWMLIRGRLISAGFPGNGIFNQVVSNAQARCSSRCVHRKRGSEVAATSAATSGPTPDMAVLRSVARLHGKGPVQPRWSVTRYSTLMQLTGTRSGLINRSPLFRRAHALCAMASSSTGSKHGNKCVVAGVGIQQTAHGRSLPRKDHTHHVPDDLGAWSLKGVHPYLLKPGARV